MRYVLVTPAAALFTTAEAKAHLRVDHSDDDALIDAIVAAATGHLDGRAGILGRAIGSQTWRLDIDSPTGGRIPIEMPDVTVSAVKYLSPTDGSEQTWSSSEWRQGHCGKHAFVEPKQGYSWPSAYDQEDAFRVTFTCGIPATEPAMAAVKAAILLMVGDLYENRETAAVGASANVIPMTPTVDRLISPYRNRKI